MAFVSDRPSCPWRAAFRRMCILPYLLGDTERVYGPQPQDEVVDDDVQGVGGHVEYLWGGGGGVNK